VVFFCISFYSHLFWQRGIFLFFILFSFVLTVWYFFVFHFILIIKNTTLSEQIRIKWKKKYHAVRTNENKNEKQKNTTLSEQMRINWKPVVFFCISFYSYLFWQCGIFCILFYSYLFWQCGIFLFFIFILICSDSVVFFSEQIRIKWNTKKYHTVRTNENKMKNKKNTTLSEQMRIKTKKYHTVRTNENKIINKKYHAVKNKWE
jgi:mannitol-specific phosphotransferase system IIBC component